MWIKLTYENNMKKVFVKYFSMYYVCLMSESIELIWSLLKKEY